MELIRINPLIYLAGPIDGCSYGECTDWRKYAIEELAKEGIIGISPMRTKEFLKKYPKICEGIEKNVLTCDRGIVSRDTWDIRRCDAVLFNLLGAKKVSIGTSTEYGMAHILNKPIITVMEKPVETKDGKIQNVHEHAMIRDMTDYRVETLDAGLDVIKSLFSYSKPIKNRSINGFQQKRNI